MKSKEYKTDHKPVLRWRESIRKYMDSWTDPKARLKILIRAKERHEKMIKEYERRIKLHKKKLDILNKMIENLKEKLGEK